MIRRLALALVLLATAPCFAAHPPPRDLDARVGFDQHVGDTLPMDLPLVDADGHPRTLGAVGDGKPLLLAFGYYRCPNLCDLTLHGIAHAAAAMPLKAGTDYRIVFLSVAPEETAADAGAARSMLDEMTPGARARQWAWATAAPSTIDALTRAVGFRYFRDPSDGQYVHPAGLIVVTPRGRIAQYFFGVDHDPSALRLALVDASAGRLGTVIDRLVLFCHGYDPATGRYSLLIERLMMALGSAFVVAMLAGAWWLRRRTP